MDRVVSSFRICHQALIDAQENEADPQLAERMVRALEEATAMLAQITGYQEELLGRFPHLKGFMTRDENRSYASASELFVLNLKDLFGGPDSKEFKLALDANLSMSRADIKYLRDETDWFPYVDRMVGRIRQFITFYGFGITLVDRERKCFVSIGIRNGVVDFGTEHPLPLTLEKAVHSGQPVYRRSLEEQRVGGDFANREGTRPEDIRRSILDVPFEGGTMAINHARADAFDDGDIRVMQAFATVMSEAYTRFKEIGLIYGK